MEEIVALVLVGIMIYLVIQFLSANWVWIVTAIGIGLLLYIICKVLKRKSNSAKSQNPYSPKKQKGKPPVPAERITLSEEQYFLYYYKANRFCFTTEDGFHFEDFISKIFSTLGFTFIAAPGQASKLVGNQNDKGIDLIFEKDMPILMQCKCYSNELWDNVVDACQKRKNEAKHCLPCDFQYWLITNNHTARHPYNILMRYGIRCILLEELRALYRLSKKVDSKYAFHQNLVVGECTEFTPEVFSYCKLEDNLKLIIYKNNPRHVFIYHNSLCIYKADEEFAVALIALYGFMERTSLDCKIVEKDGNSITIEIQLLKPVPPLQDYQKLLDDLKPMPAA